MRLVIRNEKDAEPEIEMWLEREGKEIVVRAQRGDDGYSYDLLHITEKGITRTPGIDDVIGIAIDEKDLSRIPDVTHGRRVY